MREPASPTKAATMAGTTATRSAGARSYVSTTPRPIWFGWRCSQLACDTFYLLTARYRAKKVSRLIDFSIKCPACHAGAVTNPLRSALPSSEPKSENRIRPRRLQAAWPKWQVDEMNACRTNREQLCLFLCLDKPFFDASFARSAARWDHI